VAALGWAVVLRLAVSGAAYPPNFAFPGKGLGSAAALWISGRDLFGFFAVASATLVGVVALVRRGINHPLAAIVLLQLVMTSMLAPMPMTMSSIARVVEPLLCLGLIAALTPSSAVERATSTSTQIARSETATTARHPVALPVPAA
jgi:hypothetical protein